MCGAWVAKAAADERIIRIDATLVSDTRQSLYSVDGDSRVLSTRDVLDDDIRPLAATATGVCTGARKEPWPKMLAGP